MTSEDLPEWCTPQPLTVRRPVVPSGTVEAFDPDFSGKTRREGECWVWVGSRLPSGYGRLSGDRYAHRHSWELARGPIPEGLFVLHHCDNPPCVRPDHLYLGTALDNAQDRERRGRTNRINPTRTQCVHGHPFSPENVIRFGDGWQRCRTCARARHRAYRARKTA